MSDPFKTDTERLNSQMRRVIDALRIQIMENPAAPSELKEALESLNRAATEFTNTFYEGLE